MSLPSSPKMPARLSLPESGLATSVNPVPPKPRNFNDLSDDILNIILDLVVPMSDLVSLLRANKRIYSLCLRRLYRVAAITVGGGFDEVYVPMLNANNQGLKHVRVLDMGIDQDNVCDGSYRQSQFMQVYGVAFDLASALANRIISLGMFLEVLPRDTLEEFIWRSWDPLTAENTKRLCRTQQKMKYLEAGGVEPQFTQKMIAEWQMDKIFDQVDELGFFLDSKGAMELSNAMLTRLKKPLRKLILTSHVSAEESMSQEQICDSSTRPGLLTSTVFAHMLPFHKTAPIKLDEIAFNDVYLRHPRDTFCKIFDFANITRLVLEKCKGAEVLLSELCRGSLLPTRLKTLQYLHTEQTQDNESLRALEDFLSLLTGLRELAIDLQYASRLPNVSKITAHAKTLKVLSVHAYESNVGAHGSEEEHRYSNEDFAVLCKACTQLEELSVAFPAQEIFEANNERYLSYKNSIMGPESRLDGLHTLQITTWPTTESLSDETPRTFYDAMLRVRAMEFFKARDTAGKLPKLHLIEWGSEGCFHRRCILSGTNCTIFVRSTEHTPDGRMRASCVSVVPDWRQSKLSLPTEVLSFTLAKHKYPPTMSRTKEDHESGNAPIGYRPQKMPDVIDI